MSHDSEDVGPLMAIIAWAIVAAIMYWSAAAFVWTIRNPMANEMTVFTYAGDVLTWKKLDKFQPVEK